MKIIQSLVAISLISSLLAAESISSESGFSGFIAGGVTTLSYKSNMVAGTKFDDEMADKRIDNLNDKPDSKSTSQPSLNYSLKYTFADIQTEIFLGKDLEDVLTFDNMTAIGARKHFDGFGTLGVSALVTTMATQVWEDPYKTHTNRNSTDMTSNGVAIKWESILDSDFDVELRARTFDIDGGDNSGLSPTYGLINPLNLSPIVLNDQLDREGDLSQVIVSYNWNINKQHHLKTSLRYSDYDLDGDAMQHTKTGIKFDYIYTGKTWNFVAVANLAQSDYDNTNPLFADEADASIYGGSLTAMYKNPFGLSKDLSFTTTIAGQAQDSDIDFYDSSVALLNVGLLYKF